MEIRVREVDPADLDRDAPILGRLAEEIWTEHYTPIIGAAQVSYMLERFQSAAAIAEQITRMGYRYWLAEDGAVPIGYCAAVAEADHDRLFLSKLYVLDSYRRHGVARRFLEVLEQVRAKSGLPRIQLTVAKPNTDSIAAYEKLGFTVVGAVDTDIGGGFSMDDYVMEYRPSPPPAPLCGDGPSAPAGRAATMVLWRHGVTDWNAEHRFQGCNADLGLNGDGMAQASAAAPGVASWNPSAIVTSPLLRARQTSTAVENLLNRRSVVDDRLKEIDVGAWSGLTANEIMARDQGYAAARRAEADFRQGGTGETAMELGARVGAALREWARDDETTLIVSHGWSLQMGVANLLGWDYAESRTLTVMRNCAISVVARVNGRWRIEIWNSQV